MKLTHRQLLPWQISLLVLLTVFVYLPCITGDFLYDGVRWIAMNSRVSKPGQYWRIWTDTSQDDFWPLTYSLFWLEWRLWETYTVPYHVISLALHIANSLLIWRILRQLRVPGAYLAALIFAVHPVNVATVGWIFQQKTLLAAFFGLASLTLFLRFEQTQHRRDFIWSWLLFVASLLAKTSTVMLPVVLLGYRWYRKARIDWKDLLRLSPFFAASLASGLSTIWAHERSIRILEEATDVSLGERVTGAAWAICFYIAKTFVPIHLSFVYAHWDYDFSNSRTYIPLAAVALAALLAAVNWKRWGLPLLACAAYLAIVLFPVLGFWQLHYMQFSQVADHWQYLALPATIATAVAATVNLLSRQPQNLRRCAAVFTGTCVVLLAVLTARQATHYNNEHMLWLDSISKNPNAAMLYNNLSVWIDHQGDRRNHPPFQREARRLAWKSVELEPRSGPNHLNVADLAEKDGQLDVAIEQYRIVLKRLPDDALTHVKLANVLAESGDYNSALEQYRIALSLVPADYDLSKRLKQQVEQISDYIARRNKTPQGTPP